MTSEIIPSDARRALQDGATLLDVRTPAETVNGTINGAVLLPLDELAERAETVLPDTTAPVIVYCASGVRSARAVETLRALGYRDVRSLAGGYTEWLSDATDEDDPATSERYRRHVMLPDVGLDGQRRLLQSRALIVGAGGLGSPAALYLAAAGVSTISIVDDDVVELSNLQRQILHRTASIGQPKATSAAATLTALNPDVTVRPIAERVSPSNAADLISGHDVVIDGSDNFATRYVLNDVCMAARIPLVHGSIFRFDGQLMTIDPRIADAPCYRCVFAEAPPDDLAPSCAAAGVLGVLPGIVGTLQAAEAIKLLLGIGEPLIGRLLTVDALTSSFRRLTVRQRPGCPAHHS